MELSTDMAHQGVQILEGDEGYCFVLPDSRHLGLLTYSGQLSDFRGEIVRTRIIQVRTSRKAVLRTLRSSAKRLIERYFAKTQLPAVQPGSELRDRLREEFQQALGQLSHPYRLKRFPFHKMVQPRVLRLIGHHLYSQARGLVSRILRTPDHRVAVDTQFLMRQRRRLEALKNRHRGARCFIIGNGPSLNRIDLGQLRNELTFGVNGIFYKTRETGFRPSYYVVEDEHVLFDNLETINHFDCDQKFFPDVYVRCVPHDANTVCLPTDFGFYRAGHPGFAEPGFSQDCSEIIYAGQTVTYLCLQLAFHMGFSEVYLVGMDFYYTVPSSTRIVGCDYFSREDDPNHFHKDYFGKGKRWHDPRLDRVEIAYRKAKEEYERHGRKIMNATVGGRLEIFPRVDFSALFPQDASASHRVFGGQP